MLSLGILAFLPWTLREVLQKLRRSFRDCAVSLTLYMRANVLDAPYLSSLIILKAADAAANQRNARPRYNSALLRFRMPTFIGGFTALLNRASR